MNNDQFLYTPRVVERLLEQYPYLKSQQTGKAGKSKADSSTKVDTKHSFKGRELPLGAVRGQVWPFMEPHTASSHIDGKHKARLNEDMACSMIDLETGLQKLTRHERSVVIAVHIEGYTYEEVGKALGINHRMSTHRLVGRMVNKLCDHMNGVAYV